MLLYTEDFVSSFWASSLSAVLSSSILKDAFSFSREEILLSAALRRALVCSNLCPKDSCTAKCALDLEDLCRLEAVEVNVTVVGIEEQKAGFEELHTVETETEGSEVAVFAEGQVTGVAVAEMVAGGITVHVIGFEEAHTT